MNTTLGNSVPVGSNCIAPKGSKTISNDVRKRLIDAHDAGLTYKQMSQLSGVKVDTAYRICSMRKSPGSTIQSNSTRFHHSVKYSTRFHHSVTF